MISNVWSAPYVGSSPTPINDVQLEYNSSTQTLHIEARHVTIRLNKNFVRKVIIIKNLEEIQTFVFSRQARPDKFIEDIKYTAKPGDHLDVELWGSLGGKGTASLDIPKSEEKNDAQEALSSRK